MIPAPFGSPDALLYPPADEQLEASADCARCGWHGTRFVWPMLARVGAGELRMETPVGCERKACPDCGTPLPTPRDRHPSTG